MSDVKFSELLTASYLSRNDYIVILRSGSATQPELEQDPNNYTVQAKFFTASYATHSISSSHALTASYFKFSDINAGVGVFTTLSSGVVTGTNITSSNITASGYVSASSMRAAISMSSPIGIFTNTTSSNITASGYISASTIQGVTSVTSPIAIFTAISASNITASNITASNISASGYISASTIQGVTSVTSPIAIFTAISASNITASNITASNISASGYISASAMSSSLFHGTASYSLTASVFHPPLDFSPVEESYLAVSFSSTPNSNSGKTTLDSGYEYFWTKNNKIGKIGHQKLSGFLTNVNNSAPAAGGPYVNFSEGFMVKGYQSLTKSMIDTSNRNIKKLCSTPLNLYVLFDDGMLIGWGSGSSGQLGQGAGLNPTYIDAILPTGGPANQPALGTSPWFQISGTGSLAGKTVIDMDIFAADPTLIDSSSLLILTSTASGNNLHVCGRNGYGQLGYNTNSPQHIPLQIGGQGPDVTNSMTMSKIFAGSVTSHIISHADHGSILYAAGRNTSYALGTGDSFVSTPAPANKLAFVPCKAYNSNGVPTTATDVKTIILGQSHLHLFQSFIIKNDDSVWAAGRNERGQLGNINLSALSQSTYIPCNFSASSISVHYQHSSTATTDNLTYTAILTGNSGNGIKSWGYNAQGLVGDGTTDDYRDAPTSPSLIGNGGEIAGKTVVKVASGWASGLLHVCNYILTSDGSVYSTGKGTNRSSRGLNQSYLDPTFETRYQKLLFNMKSGEKVVDISTGHRSSDYAALYLLTNMGNILVCGTGVANGQPKDRDSYMPKYVYRNGQFVSYISTV